MIVDSPFKPAWWLRNAHLQTLWPYFFRGQRRVPVFRRERLELPDGDFLDLDWTRERAGPLVVVLHGLGGCSRSHYAAGLLHALETAGFQAVLMHFRGCGGEPNRLARSYHAGDTADIHYTVEQLGRRFDDRPTAAAGFSLGGNALLKWLGETGHANPLTAAVAISVPFDLSATATHMDRGASRIYRNYLLDRTRQAALAKLGRKDFPIMHSELTGLNTFRAFDDRVTAPLHGFASAEDYYARASAGSYLKDIEKRTLILHAKDDPLVPLEAVPPASALSASVTLELSPHGGHVGFVTGSAPGRARYWLDGRIVKWLKENT